MMVQEFVGMNVEVSGMTLCSVADPTQGIIYGETLTQSKVVKICHPHTSLQ